MRETQVRFEGLAGVLTEPDIDRPVPVILMLHGSGPLDRDENTPAQKLNVFNRIAEDLARRGFASLRYDKRGCGASSGVFLKANQTDFVNDAALCLDRLTSEYPDRFSARYALGHSEGTAVAARLSLERKLDGLILLCPFIEDMETILTAQAAQMDAALQDAPGFSGMAQRAIAGLVGRPSVWQARLIRRIRTSRKPVIRFAGQRLAASWLRECLDQDLPALYGRVTAPALVVGGGKDIQCNPNDVARIGAILGPNAETHVYPDLTHLLRTDPGPASFTTYPAQMKRPLDRVLLQHIGNWLDRQVAAQAH